MRILSALLLLLFATAGAPTSQAWAQQWSEYRSAEGRYRVEMPGAPTLETAPVNVSGGRKTTLYQALVEPNPDVSYFASYVDYPKDVIDAVPAQTHLMRARDGSGGRKVISDKVMSVAGYPAREYAIDQADGMKLLIRSVLAGNRLYQIIVVRNGTPPLNYPETTRFLDSFNILSQ